MIAEARPVAVGRTGVVALPGIAERRRQDREPVPLDFCREPGAFTELIQMAEQSEAGDVGDRVDPLHPGQIGADGVELGGALHHFPVALGIELVLVHGRAQNADAEALAEHQHVAGQGVRVALDLVRVHQADDREAVDRFRRIDGVAAADGDAGIQAGLGAALQNALDLLGGHFVDRKTGNGQGHDRLAAHGVDVAKRIGGRDPAIVVRVVDDGHEEVGGRDHALLIVDPVDSRVVTGLEPDQQGGIGGRFRQVVQHML